MSERPISALFHVEAIEQEPYLVKLWHEERWVMMTEKEVEWLIWELRRAAFGKLITHEEMWASAAEDAKDLYREGSDHLTGLE
jgi:hypothetical protein